MDPNARANELAKLSVQLALDAQQKADAARNTFQATSHESYEGDVYRNRFTNAIQDDKHDEKVENNSKQEQEHMHEKPAEKVEEKAIENKADNISPSSKKVDKPLQVAEQKVSELSKVSEQKGEKEKEQSQKNAQVNAETPEEAQKNLLEQIEKFKELQKLHNQNSLTPQQKPNAEKLEKVLEKVENVEKNETLEKKSENENTEEQDKVQTEQELENQKYDELEKEVQFKNLNNDGNNNKENVEELTDAQQQELINKRLDELQMQQPVPEKPVEENESENENEEEKDENRKLVIKGVHFGLKHPKTEDKRIDDVIVAKIVDENRDKEADVSLSQYNLNYVFGKPDSRDHKFSTIYNAIDANALPSKVDLRDNWGTILDQLDIGSCVSNSVSYCLRYCYKKQKMGDFTPSRLFIYYNGRVLAKYPIDKDTGLTIRDGYKSVATNSVCGENNWPYVPAKFATKPLEGCYNAAKLHKTFRYISLDNDLVQMKKCLKDGFPISFGAALFSSFMSATVAKTGIVSVPDPSKEQRCGGHALSILGYDDSKKAFLVCNSWGAGWGDKGFCWFPYSYMTNDEYVGDMWSVRNFS